MKIALNGCFAEAALSKAAYDLLGLPWDGYGFAFSEPNLEVRTDPNLIRVLEILGKKANSAYAEWYIATIPDDVSVRIHEYDGMESVHETHRVWTRNGSHVE